MAYDGWKIRKFEYIGLAVDLPAQAEVSPSAKGPATLSISTHYLSPPPGVLDDAMVFVHVYVERILRSRLAEEKADYKTSGLYRRGNEANHKYWFWHYDLHPETALWDDEDRDDNVMFSGKGHFAYYRRDVPINDKEILHVHAEVLSAGPRESREADHAAVKRIIDSLIPLPAKP